jgi:hypothetical protein
VQLTGAVAAQLTCFTASLLKIGPILGPWSVVMLHALLRSLSGFCLVVLIFGGLPIAAADEFVPPPQVERDAVAALNKNATARVIVDGNYRVVTVQMGPSATNDTLKHLAGCEKLTTVSISSPQIDDEGVNQLQALTSLTSLSITSSGISQNGVDALIKGMPNCRVSALNLRGGFQGPGGPGGGPPGGFGFGRSTRVTRIATLARNTAVQDELKLTEDQKKGISDASTSTFQSVLEAIDTKVMAVLNNEQKARLKQIELQQLGIVAVLRPEVAKQLKLTDEQQAAVQKLLDDRQDADREKKALALLTDEQRKTWEGMLGPKGPDLQTGSTRVTDPASVAKSLFDRYDTDQDGKMSDTEFPTTNRTRQSIERSGITLTFPVPREEFEKSFVKYLEGWRR